MMKQLDPAISVIIPVYKAEKYIEACARSLFEQSFKSIEYIFIDDCSPDESVQVLQEVINSYPERASQVTIIRNNSNKGISSVRNIGLKRARGQFIGWVDSDDWVESTMYSDLYQAALSGNSDIVWCDYYNTYPDREDRQHQFCNASPLDYIKALLLCRIHGGLCFTIIKKSLFTDHSIYFPEGRNVMEDKTVLIKLASFAQRVTYVAEAYYHYIKYNESSITSNWAINSKVEQAAMANLENIFSFLRASDLGVDFTRDILYAKIVFKKGYLNNPDMEAYSRWKTMYTEAHRYLLTCPNTTLKQKILGWFISRDCHLPVKLWIKLKK